MVVPYIADGKGRSGTKDQDIIAFSVPKPRGRKMFRVELTDHTVIPTRSEEILSC